MDWDEMHRMILQLDLPMPVKNLVLVRFRRIFGYIDGHYRTVQMHYNNSRMFVITASIINPALLSIASSDPSDTINLGLFWFVWVLQILVSLVTAYIAFFKWDKKYFVYMVYKQRAEQEIWTYLELTGRYSIIDPLQDDEVVEMKTTHHTKVKLLLSQLEIIYRKLQDADTSIQHMDSDSDKSRTGSPRLVTSGGPTTGYDIRSFASEVQYQRQRRLEATERKLESLSTQLSEETDNTKRNNIEDRIRMYNQMRHRNMRIDSQWADLYQGFDDKHQSKRE